MIHATTFDTIRIVQPDGKAFTASGADLVEAAAACIRLRAAAQANQRNLAAQLTARMAALNRLQDKISDHEFMRLSVIASNSEKEAMELTAAALEHTPAGATPCLKST